MQGLLCAISVSFRVHSARASTGVRMEERTHRLRAQPPPHCILSISWMRALWVCFGQTWLGGGRMPALAEQLGMKKVLHHGGAACRGRYQISSMWLGFRTRSLGLEKEMRACWPPSWPRLTPAEDIVLLGCSTAAAGEAELS